MTMTSNSEDLELFLKEFMRLLNKYHYYIYPFMLRLITEPSTVCVGFDGDGCTLNFKSADINQLIEMSNGGKLAISVEDMRKDLGINE
jgi:hypothetical protein